MINIKELLTICDEVFIDCECSLPEVDSIEIRKYNDKLKRVLLFCTINYYNLSISINYGGAFRDGIHFTIPDNIDYKNYLLMTYEVFSDYLLIESKINLIKLKPIIELRDYKIKKILE